MLCPLRKPRFTVAITGVYVHAGLWERGHVPVVKVLGLLGLRRVSSGVWIHTAWTLGLRVLPLLSFCYAQTFTL